MAIEQWDPFREAVSLRDAMNMLFQDSFVRPTGPAASSGNLASLLLDISETSDAFVVKASLPGIKPEDVDITVHGDVLTIRGECKGESEKRDEHWHLRERRFGAFQRSISLPTSVSPDKAQADYEHGVLTLTLPKSESAKPRQIKIGASSPSSAKSANEK